MCTWPSCSMSTSLVSPCEMDGVVKDKQCGEFVTCRSSHGKIIKREQTSPRRRPNAAVVLRSNHTALMQGSPQNPSQHLYNMQITKVAVRALLRKCPARTLPSWFEADAHLHDGEISLAHDTDVESRGVAARERQLGSVALGCVHSQRRDVKATCSR